MKLLLFDIDGTLLVTRGLGRRAVEAALSELCGRPVSTQGVRFSGKTDPQIFREVLAASGFDPAEAEALLPDVMARYAALLAPTLRPEYIDVLPGVPGLLAALADRDDVHLALLTGNLEPMAFAKLAAVGLDAYFAFGAFGSDHADRHRLPAVAVERAARHTGRRYSGKQVVIIGDTEHDVRCGRGIGAFAVGVCTGSYTRDDLAAHGPDLLLDDLTDPAALLGALFA